LSIRIINRIELQKKVLTLDQVVGSDFHWSEYFDEDLPLVLDAGCGKGEFIAEQAVQEPHFNFIGIDYSIKKCLLTAKKFQLRQISNAAVIRASFEDVLPVAFQPGGFKRIHMNYPDPWPKRRHNKRRSMNKELVKIFCNLLCEEGDLFFVTDYFEYARTVYPLLEVHPFLENQVQDNWFLPELEAFSQTLFYHKTRSRGEKAYFLWFKKHSS